MKIANCVLLALLLCATPLWAAPLTDNGNATVTDQATGLVWQKKDDGTTKTWQSALDYCNALSMASSSDWRLPNIKELRSIVDESGYNPSIDPVFNGTNASIYWSSSSSAYSPGTAWFVSFGYGDVSPGNKTYNYYVRCVR
jgi:hypothetical protein